MDYEEIEEIEQVDSIADVASAAISILDWFLLFIVALSFLFVISDVYINQLLIKIPNAVKYGEPTAWGCVIQMVSQLVIIIMASSIKKFW